MKIYNLLNMGIKTLLATAVGGLALAGCEASADTKNKPEATQVASMRVIDQAKTQADCLKLGLETNEKIMVCMRDVTARESAVRQAEIAAKTDQRAGNAETIAGQEQEAEQLDTTIKVLSEVRDEAFEKADDPSR
ncbi:MAG: hypothetical protein COB20_07120 [SAR86 cluster bacterium]|uniref:Uncharacterized protein n=1 Tax=SAR86 cluster bacterium TaxID=2030880 RepID=A0A2A4X686_9GAMM|nr:MAG: hypothetical protein COB20_07120 [SAR86 cluster bacterium]